MEGDQVVYKDECVNESGNPGNNTILEKFCAPYDPYNPLADTFPLSCDCVRGACTSYPGDADKDGVIDDENFCKKNDLDYQYGPNVFTAATTINNELTPYFDRCVNEDGSPAASHQSGYLKEYYCNDSGGGLISEVIECDCRNGACVSECTDSDGGLDYYTIGTCESSNGEIVQDSCEGDSVWELTCDENELCVDGDAPIDCPDGCINGACVNSTCSGKQCCDGIDNDGDGAIDLYDAECKSSNDDTERSGYCTRNLGSPGSENIVTCYEIDLNINPEGLW